MPTRRVLKGFLGGKSNAQLGDDPILTAIARGVVVSLTGLVCQEFAQGAIRHTRFTFTNVSISTTDNTTAGANGSQKLYDFPATGQVAILGGSIKIGIARVGTGLGVSAALVTSVGTTAAANDNGTLTTTEANIVGSTTATLSSGANAAVLGGNGPSATALAADSDAYLNFAVPDAGTSGNDAVLVNGTVDIFWMPLNA